MTERFHLHLVSDATGETITSVARACLVQFEGVDVEEHIWNLVRTERQGRKVLVSVEANPGLVAEDVTVIPTLYEGYDYIQRRADPRADNRDAFYLAAGFLPKWA